MAGIQPYTFSNDAEKQRWILLAAEALLVYGGFYNGDAMGEGYARVEVEGRAKTLKDFDYRAHL